MKLDSYLLPYTKITQNRFKNLTVRVKTIKLLEENVGMNLHDFAFGNGFFDITPKRE